MKSGTRKKVPSTRVQKRDNQEDSGIYDIIYASVNLSEDRLRRLRSHLHNAKVLHLLASSKGLKESQRRAENSLKRPILGREVHKSHLRRLAATRCRGQVIGSLALHGPWRITFAYCGCNYVSFYSCSPYSICISHVYTCLRHHVSYPYITRSICL